MENLYYYLAFFVSLLFIIKCLSHPRQNMPPSPLALPILGHLYLIRNLPHQELERLSSKYGPILFLRFGALPILVISSPSAVEECFTKNDVIFANRPRTMASDCLSYNYTVYAFASYGDSWRSLRRLSVIEVFSSKSLQKSSIIREKETCELLSELFKVSTIGNQKLELRYWFSLLTFNILMRLVSGEPFFRYETLKTEEGRQALHGLREKFRPTIPLNMCDFFPILRWIHFKGLEKSMKILHKKRDEFLQGLLDEFRGKKAIDSPNSGESNLTLMETLLCLQESEPDSYSDDVIKSIILTMFAAGSETSVITMEYAISLLLSHPKELHKLRGEIDNRVGHERLLDDSDLDKLPFLNCVMRETLRLHPPAPLLLPHYASENCQVGGFDVQKGTILLVNAWAMQRDTKVWEEPDKFKPERFESMESDRERFKSVPFGVGRRECPGAHMAMRTALLAVGALIQCFDLEMVVGEEERKMDQGFGPTMSRGQPLNVLCTPRPTLVDLLS